MKLSLITTLLAFGLTALAIPTPDEVEDQGIEQVDDPIAPEPQAKNYPKILKYDQRQSNNAWAIINQIKAEKYGSNALTACKAAFATALVESNIYIYANVNVPKSLKYPYDKKGKDHDSVGVFQQRAKYYPLAKAMDPAKSVHLFFEKMEKVKDWKKKKTDKQIGELCQKVQVSAYPDKYRKRVAEAAKICKVGKIG